MHTQSLVYLVLALMLSHCGAADSSQLSAEPPAEADTPTTEHVAFVHLQLLIDPLYELSADTVPIKQDGRVMPAEIKLAPLRLSDLQYCQGKCRVKGDPSPNFDQGMAPFSPPQLVYEADGEEVEANSLLLVDLKPTEKIAEDGKTFALYANTPKGQSEREVKGVNFGTFLGQIKQWRGDGTNWILGTNLFTPVIQQSNGSAWVDFVYTSPAFDAERIDFTGANYRILLRKNSSQ